VLTLLLEGLRPSQAPAVPAVAPFGQSRFGPSRPAGHRITHLAVLMLRFYKPSHHAPGGAHAPVLQTIASYGQSFLTERRHSHLRCSGSCPSASRHSHLRCSGSCPSASRHSHLRCSGSCPSASRQFNTPKEEHYIEYPGVRAARSRRSGADSGFPARGEAAGRMERFVQ